MVRLVKLTFVNMINIAKASWWNNSIGALGNKTKMSSYLDINT